MTLDCLRVTWQILVLQQENPILTNPTICGNSTQLNKRRNWLSMIGLVSNKKFWWQKFFLKGSKRRENSSDPFFDTITNGFCFLPSTIWLLFCSGINNLVFVLLQHQQHSFCFVPASTTSFVLFRHQQHIFGLFQRQQHLTFGEVRRIFTRQGHIISTWAGTEWLSDGSDKARQWSDLGPIKILV